MTKKKQALLSVIGTVAVLVSLSGVVYYQVKENTTVKVQERIQKVCVLEDISRVEFKTNELLTIEKQAKGWQNPDLDYLTYDNERISEWLGLLQNVQTEKIVKNVEDETTYGISDESPMITIYDALNNSQTLFMGNINSEEQAVYVKSDEERVLYMIALEDAERLFISPNTFVEVEDILAPKVTGQLDLVKSGESKLHFVLEDRWYLKEYFDMPYPLQEGEIEKLLEDINSLMVLEYVGTYEDLSAYGLDQPQFEVIISEQEKIAFGHLKDEHVYITLNDGKDVYTTDRKVYDQLEGIDPFKVIDKQFIKWPFDAIKQIELSNPQGTYLLRLDQESIKQDEEERTEPVISEEEKAVISEDKLEIGASLNQLFLNEAEAKSWVDKINTSLYIEAQLQNPKIEQKQERRAEASIVYTFKDDSQVTIELVPYDINYYILRYNGSVQFAVNKEKITKLFTELSHLDKASEK